MSDKLRNLLTPELFHLTINVLLPFSKTEPLDFTEVGESLFGGDGLPDSFADRVWPVLEALSEVGLDPVPDLMQYLPPVSDPDFTLQALGLQLLIDQLPRALCQGVDTRWTNAYFDVINLKYAQALDALPDNERPSSWTRSKDTISLDFWVIARTWFVTPFVHTDQVAVQEHAARLTEETRERVEKETGTTDPNRSERDALLSDVYAFPRVVSGGPPKDGATLQAFAYWVCKLMDVHKPIVDKFGRYPYRNPFFGRKNTPEEDVWLEKTNNFALPSKEVRDQLQKDIDAGVWTPLGAGRAA